MLIYHVYGAAVEQLVDGDSDVRDDVLTDIKEDTALVELLASSETILVVCIHLLQNCDVQVLNN